MNETAKLLDDIDALFESSYPDRPDLAQIFERRVQALGARELLVHVFRTFADSMLRIWMTRLRFAWRALPYTIWTQILGDLSDDPRFVYQFLMFASESLAIDVRRIATPHPAVRDALRSAAFRDGGPPPQSRATRALLEDDFDYETMWRRLASEGAPMQPLPSG